MNEDDESKIIDMLWQLKYREISVLDAVDAINEMIEKVKYERILESE